jgi:hypothetical protein
LFVSVDSVDEVIDQQIRMNSRDRNEWRDGPNDLSTQSDNEQQKDKFDDSLDVNPFSLKFRTEQRTERQNCRGRAVEFVNSKASISLASK